MAPFRRPLNDGRPDEFSITRTTTRSSVSRGPRRRLRSRRPSASSPGSITPMPSPGTPPPNASSRRSTRPTRSWRPGQAQAVRRARRELGLRSAGRVRPGACRRGPVPFAGFGGAGGGNVRYEFRTTGGDTGDFSDFFRVFFGEDAAARPAGPPAGRGRRADRRAGVRGHPRRDGHRRPTAGTGGGPRARPPSAPAGPRGTAEITLDEAYQGTTRLVEVDGKRLEITIPPGADTGTRIKLTGKAPGRRRPRGRRASVCPTAGSRAGAPTSSASSRSPSRRRCWAPRSRSRRSRVASC